MKNMSSYGIATSILQQQGFGCVCNITGSLQAWKNEEYPVEKEIEKEKNKLVHVVKIILSAIVVGMIGVLTLHHFAKVNLHIKPIHIGANIIGGLLFGVGFALTGYCPGTAAVALGQGSWDALFGVAGLIAGSWMFAELSGWTKRTVENWGDFGKVLLLPDLLSVPRCVLVVCFAAALTAFLLVLQQFATR